MAIKAATNTTPRRRAAARQSVVVRAETSSLDEVRKRAKLCRDCPLWKCGTQTVFGEGPKTARVLFVGEQPGDQEDLVGKPFVGPAGKLLDKAMGDAGIDRTRTYVTNAVKHFKFELRGKRRLHKKPSEKEILACNQWLQRELLIIKPKLVVAMGATAARAVFGHATAIQENRGRVMELENASIKQATNVLVTVHPSFLLRVPSEDRASAYRGFVKDLKLAAPFIKR